MMFLINLVLWVLALYFIIGVFFAIYFVFLGAQKIDPLLKESKWGVRLLLFPGAVATWIYLLPKIIKRS